MALRKYIPPKNNISAKYNPPKIPETNQDADRHDMAGKDYLVAPAMDADVEIDLREIYFLIMHFLSSGPYFRTYGQIWNELLEHQLLPRRYHAWYSRSGVRSGDENDDGVSLPLSYNKLVERYPHVEKDHLVKLLKQLLVIGASSSQDIPRGNTLTAADVPTLLGSGSFSLLGSGKAKEEMLVRLPTYLRWPHMQADQVHGLSLREIGGGFTKHHRAPSIRAACYAIAKPSTLMQKMQIIKKLRGHQNAVYCGNPHTIYYCSAKLKCNEIKNFLVSKLNYEAHTSLFFHAEDQLPMKAASLNQTWSNYFGDYEERPSYGEVPYVFGTPIFDRSGRYVITGSDDRLVKIWSMETAFCLSSCRGHEGDITDLAVSSNNTLVASASNDCIIRVWRLPDGVPISVLRGHTGAVTAIAFSPRPSAVYQLLSSSDDGTCRIWDARSSNINPRIYVPKPPDPTAGKSTDPSQTPNQPNHQILCCAFNANGTIFVTGSSDTHARVWNAFKPNPEDANQPNHEMDLLSGHENDVNYVQFSGCAVSSRSASADASKEENVPKFKNSWFTHDNIVTCSRDGSAIIWIPRSRRSHGKVGRWTRAYHLKVPPPPMPPQPLRGGPRQRFLPTPRGVNMIVWSLDNRFVLAAIMDCRICVWNAADGSLVHSLTGHSQSTYVLDVHPFNPRIAMSAGYDGKTIVWDIWEGVPIRTYDIGWFKLVDGKFSPDGTSIILSDEVGQIYILATGQGESQKDAKYDQFFLGDYRALIQDTNGNVLDQETQLQPYRRNMQDLLCDYSLIPYPDPYQSMYQQRRLGALGIEWHPPSVNLAVGPVDVSNLSIQDYRLHFPQVHLDGDLDRWPEQPTEFLEVVDWEPDNDIQSDDNDSEYNVTEQSSEGEHCGVSVGSGDSFCSGDDSEAEDPNDEHLRRSKRKRQKDEVEFVTSFGRRVKRRNLDENDVTLSHNTKSRRRRNGQGASRRKCHTVKSGRPQRVAARNALNLFSRIGGVSSDGKDGGEDDSESGSMDDETVRDPNHVTNGLRISMCLSSERSVHQNEGPPTEPTDVNNPQEFESQTKSGNRKRLVVKFPIRDSKKVILLDAINNACHGTNFTAPSSSGALETADPQATDSNSQVQVSHVASSIRKFDSRTNNMGTDFISEDFGCNPSQENGVLESLEDRHVFSSTEHKDNDIKWGEVKARSSKRMRVGDALVDPGPSSSMQDDNADKLLTVANSQPKSVRVGQMVFDDCGTTASLAEKETGRIPRGIRLCKKDGLCGFIGNAADYSMNKTGCGTGSGASMANDERFPDQTASVSDIDFNSGGSLESFEMSTKLRKGKGRYDESSHQNNKGHPNEDGKTKPTISCTLTIKSREKGKESCGTSSSKLRSVNESWIDSDDKASPLSPTTKNEDETFFVSREVDSSTSEPSSFHETWDDIVNIEHRTDKHHTTSTSHESDSLSPKGPKRTYNAVYRRSKSSRSKTNQEMGNGVYEERNTENTRGLAARPTEKKSSLRFSRKDSATYDLKKREQYDLPEKGKQIYNSSFGTRERFPQGEWTENAGGNIVMRSTRSRRGNVYSSEYGFSGTRRIHQTARKHSWLTLSEYEGGYRYIPQKGDEVAYLRQGHQEFLELSRLQDTAPWQLYRSLGSMEFCRVADLTYSSLPGSGESCCKLSLQFNDRSSNLFGKTFGLTMPELTDFPDFLVERSRFDASMSRSWTHRDKCQVWWRSEGGEGGSWWEGRILAVKPKSTDFPESPWETCIVQYKSDSSGQHLHSPWELHDPNGPQWEHPRIDEETRKKLLTCFDELERVSRKNQDHYGLQKLQHVEEKSDFLNRFPVPLTLDLIQARLYNGYYRSVEAFEHDMTVMLMNTQSYFGKSVEMSARMKRLSEWIARKFHFNHHERSFF